MKKAWKNCRRQLYFNSRFFSFYFILSINQTCYSQFYSTHAKANITIAVAAIFRQRVYVSSKSTPQHHPHHC